MDEVEGAVVDGVEAEIMTDVVEKAAILLEEEVMMAEAVGVGVVAIGGAEGRAVRIAEAAMVVVAVTILLSQRTRALISTMATFHRLVVCPSRCLLSHRIIAAKAGNVRAVPLRTIQTFMYVKCATQRDSNRCLIRS